MSGLAFGRHLPSPYPILEPRHQRIHCQPHAQRQLRRLQPWGVGVVEKFTAIGAPRVERAVEENRGDRVIGNTVRLLLLLREHFDRTRGGDAIRGRRLFGVAFEHVPNVLKLLFRHQHPLGF